MFESLRLLCSSISEAISGLFVRICVIPGSGHAKQATVNNGCGPRRSCRAPRRPHPPSLLRGIGAQRTRCRRDARRARHQSGVRLRRLEPAHPNPRRRGIWRQACGAVGRRRRPPLAAVTRCVCVCVYARARAESHMYVYCSRTWICPPSPPSPPPRPQSLSRSLSLSCIETSPRCCRKAARRPRVCPWVCGGGDNGGDVTRPRVARGHHLQAAAV